MANHFLVFIGGTGAKCAEAFVQMAAAGAVGDTQTTFHVLTMDVDATNGNRELAIEALERYQLLRRQFPATGQFAGSSLFGPDIIHYDWHVQLPQEFPHAAGKNSLNAMRAQNSADEEAVMRLFYSDEEMGFDFSREGFHAIPAIGSPVLQYILEDGTTPEPLAAFVDALRAEVSVNSRLILVGSIFGGTGACGLPTVMRYLGDKTRDIALAGNLLTTGVLMLPYYHFAEPDQEDALGVHARKFYNNARGALAFYREMEQELAYRSLYLIGSPIDFNMGAYRPGMEGQKNPPTPVEWESALAIEHCLRADVDAGEGEGQFIKCIQGIGRGEVADSLQVSWGDLSLNVQARMGTMARFIAAYMGYYRPYITRHKNDARGFKPFYAELLKPYMDTQEAEYKALAALGAFCERAWAWMRQSLDYDQLVQGCFSQRMMMAGKYPARALHSLVTDDAAAPRWTAVEDAMFDGVRPLPPDEDEAPQRNAGLFVHGLYAHCAQQ